jgi:succinate dehydrogenase / fumarate reductase, cytochrome b subunit
MGKTHQQFHYIFSTPGKKILMGITGLVWSGFVFGHMAGNLLLFVGPDAYNTYGHLLTSGNLVYLIEAVLGTALLIHVLCALSLTRNNLRARGKNTYLMSPSGEKGVTFASKTMAIQGSLILVFVITHLVGFKFGSYYETTVNGVIMRDLHRLIFEVFSKPMAVAWYCVALISLGFHLSHGFGSIFQSLGIKTKSNASLIDKLSLAYAFVVAGGFLIQPLYVFFTR